MAIQRLLLLLPVAGAAFVAASPLPRSASVRPVLPRASVPVAVVPPPLAAALPPAVSTLRGGLLAARAPESLFNLLFLGLSGACAALVVGTRSQQQSGDSDTPAEKPEMVKAVSALKWRFLAVFWLYKMADWLQGPYFYDVYASKIINGVQVNSEGVARLFLMGFGSTAVFGAAIGGLVDSAGRKRGSLAFALMYTLSALSTRASTLPLLLGGRLVGGIGTSLLFSVRRRRAIRRRNSARNSFGAQFCGTSPTAASYPQAPEAWLVSEHTRRALPPAALSQIFGLAYFGDSLVAIGAGQLAGAVASKRGPVAPFELSTLFLAAGAAIVAATWGENFGGSAKKEAKEGEKEEGNSAGALVGEAIGEMKKDKKILLVGAVQALFEGAMYIFVLQWPPAIRSALATGGVVPYGTIFSSFMVCCMAGSTTFSALARGGATPENIMLRMLVLATTAMGTAAGLCIGGAVVPLVAAFFAFEFCVGMYFPLVGTLRSVYLPEEYRGAIMNFFGIPLNLIVVGVFLSIGKLGLQGALLCSTLALSCATVAQFCLWRLTKKAA